MKKIFFAFAIAAMAFTATAQEKTSWPGHTSNKFWDNWEVSIGVGVNTAVRDVSGGPSEGAFGDRIGIEGEVAFTKWFHPIVGARIQLQGGQFANFPYGEVNGTSVKWPYMFPHLDVMFHLSNWIGGYRDDRFYSAVIFAGFGCQVSRFTDSFQEKYPLAGGTNSYFAADFGLQNRLRLSKKFDFTVELKAWMFREKGMPIGVYGKSNLASAYSLTFGLNYRFNKRGWDKAYTQADFQKYVDEAAALRDALASANAARLAAEEAAAKAQDEAARAAARAAAAQAAADEAAARAAAASKGIFAQGNAIFFNLGSAQLTATDKVRLALIADDIKAGDQNTVYTISGYADKQTGTANVNKRISESRAKNVYKYLVSCGVNADKLKYDSYGDTVQPFGEKEYKANRAAIINK
ncbi:MAG: OmpA family protein [Alistipes sp.]|nr:OmpA family protein [Alistipes sp.]